MDDLSLRVYLENGSDAMRGGWLELPVVPERLDAFMRGVVGVDDGGGYAVVDHEPGWFGDVLGSDLESFSVSSLNLAARCVAHARDLAVESLWRDAERMASGLVPEAGADPVVLPYGTGASTPACVASRIAAGRLSAAGRPWDASFPRPDGPDCGKARFRLMTDMLHLGGEKGSVLFGVTRQTVFAWRHPRMRDSVPSPAAADGRRRMAPPLTFYRLRSDWEAWHGPDDGGWRSEDCSVWLAAVLLHDMGLEPSVVYAEADPEAMF